MLNRGLARPTRAGWRAITSWTPPSRKRGLGGQRDMAGYCGRAIALGLFLVPTVMTPAVAESARSAFGVSATVVSNCRADRQALICTRGTPLPRVRAGVVTTLSPAPAVSRGAGALIQGQQAAPRASGQSDTVTVTVNY